MIEIGHHRLWHFMGLAFHADTIISMFIVSGIIIFLAVFIRIFLMLHSKKKLTYLQTAVEMILEALKGLPASVMGKSGEKYVPLISTLFVFILISNWFALVPVNAVYALFFDKWLGRIPEITAPTTDLNFTAGLALIVFFSTHFFGIIEKKGAYFSRFFIPRFTAIFIFV
ncbi:MAG: F0F1 ATP synthase subunit A [Candidatus Margulisiibacteriota bacterium]